MKKYGQRLEAIFSLITPCELFADIGTDHGFIAGFAAEKAQKVIAADISDSCLKKARQNIRADNVDFRVGDGLSVLDGDADIIAVCGMGGHTIAGILSGYSGKAKLILQPQSEQAHLRRFLLQNGYQIEKDFVVCEKNKFYDIMQATKNFDFSIAQGGKEIDERMLLFGRFYREKNEGLQRKLQKMRQNLLTYKQTEENIKFLKQIEEALSYQD